MVKFIKTFEEGEIKSVLHFRARIFSLTMGLWVNGERKSKEKGLDMQLRTEFPNDEAIDEIAEAADILSYGDEAEIEEAIETLENYE